MNIENITAESKLNEAELKARLLLRETMIYSE